MGALIGAYLEELERQMATGEQEFQAFRELSLAAEHFSLIVNVNAPDLWTKPLHDAARIFGTLLGSQQPIGGMSGQINQTMVRQFRLPGYPFVLVTTDLLQEGEDLHTFCSAVYHYGISWMPSSMEQRIGRIDRVNSETERRLTGLGRAPKGDDKLQVYYPYLSDTVEVLQVRRVLERMNRFIRLMHKDLAQPEGDRKQLHIPEEILRVQRDIPPIEEVLESAFPVREELLAAPSRPLAVAPEVTAGYGERFRRIPSLSLGGLRITWEANAPQDALMGTVLRDGRQQPFTLLLRSFDGRLLLRCVSPIGRQDWGYDVEDLAREAFSLPVQVSGLFDERHQTRLFAAEAELLLGDEAHDGARTQWLIDRTTAAADRLEMLLSPGTDAPLEGFRADLEAESDHAE
jgi:hypothetical protein